MKTTNEMTRVRKSVLSYKNPKTGNVVGYLRALQLHITKSAPSGFLNPNTGKLITNFERAKSLGLFKPKMFKRRIR